MTNECSRFGWSGAGIALAGPMVMGAVLGLPSGVARMLTESLLLPAVVLGVAVLMAPALYIGLSLIGAAPPAAAVLSAFGAGLRACGILLAGLAPATAFLIVTANGTWAVWAFGSIVVAAGALLGLRRLFGELRDDSTSALRTAPLYAVWSLVSLGLGVHFFLQTLNV